MRISVAMATYNGERFLREQLDSLARQTLPPSELVIGDDGSTDNTLEIIGGFARTAPFPIRVYRNEVNLGFTLNFLQTAARCSGELIAFCDQDDIWLPNKLERCVGVFRDRDIVLMIHSAEVIDETGAKLGKRHPVVERPGKWSGSGRCPLHVLPPGFSMVLRHEVLEALWAVWPMELYRELREKHGNLFGHDVLLFLVARGAGWIYFDREVLAFFRVHGRNTTVPHGAFSWTGARFLRGVVQAARTGAPAYRRIAETRRAELRLLEALCRLRNFTFLEELRTKWCRVAVGLEERGQLYESRGGDYWWRYARLVATGRYASRARGGLGLRSAIKDFGVGFLRGSPVALDGRSGGASAAKPAEQ